MIGEDYLLNLKATPSQVEVYGDELQSDTEQQVILTTEDSSGKEVDQLTLYVNGQQEPDKVASKTVYTIHSSEFPKAPISSGVEMKEYTFQTRLVKDKIYPSNIVTVPVSTYTFGATFSGAYYATSGQNIDPNEISKLLNTYYIKNRGGEPSYQWVDSNKCFIKNNALNPNGSNQIIVPSDSNEKKYEACLNMTQNEEAKTRIFNVKIPIEVVDKIPAGKQLYFEQSDVTIDKDFKDQSEYVQGNQLLELSQPFIKEGNQITSSYKQAPLSFKVKFITFNDDQTSGIAEICYTDSICDSITFSEESPLTLNPQVLVPSTLNFENIPLPIQEPGTSYRDDKDWDIKVVNVNNLERYSVFISQITYFSRVSNEDKKLEQGINIVYTDNQKDNDLFPNGEGIVIPSNDFKLCDGNQYCTQWGKNQGLILKYNNDLNDSLRDCNKSSSCEYQATLEFTLESAF